MASIAESKLAGFGGEPMRHAIARSISEFRAAREHLEAATGVLPELVEFLRANWDEEYEERLREAGFKGSLFIIREFKIHLDAIKQGTAAQLTSLEAGLKQVEAGKRVEPMELVLESSTRGLCRSLIRFLDFEDRTAQTQLVNISIFAARE